MMRFGFLFIQDLFDYSSSFPFYLYVFFLSLFLSLFNRYYTLLFSLFAEKEVIVNNF